MLLEQQTVIKMLPMVVSAQPQPHLLVVLARPDITIVVAVASTQVALLVPLVALLLKIVSPKLPLIQMEVISLILEVMSEIMLVVQEVHVLLTHMPIPALEHRLII